MINKNDLAMALLTKANEIATTNSYTLIPFGMQYNPNASDTYITESCLFGDDNSIGMANNSSDIQFGVYQISIYTPKTDVACRWSGLEIADKFTCHFAMGLKLTYNAQTVEIIKASLTTPRLSDTHLAHILSVRFNVIN